MRPYQCAGTSTFIGYIIWTLLLLIFSKRRFNLTVTRSRSKQVQRSDGNQETIHSFTATLWGSTSDRRDYLTDWCAGLELTGMIINLPTENPTVDGIRLGLLGIVVRALDVSFRVRRCVFSLLEMSLPDIVLIRLTIP